MSDDEIIIALQKGIPLESNPFAELADELGRTEPEVLSALSGAKADGIVRRFGAVFDTRRLGYHSALCAVAVPAGEVDAVAAKVTPLIGVTHCYLREVCNECAVGASAVKDASSAASAGSIPNLWFTLSYPTDVFQAMADEVADRLKPYEIRILPATKRYKVDVVFGAATRVREEGVEDDLPPLTSRERAIIGALQGDTEIRSDYFAAIAEKLGMKEWDLLSTLELWRRNGRLKRIGLLLRHRTAGWKANGMCCWRVEGDTTGVGRALAECGEVTHCYERPFAPNFPYNMFAMIHSHVIEEAQEKFRALDEVVAGACGGRMPSTMLLSTKEYKKTSMTFFAGKSQI